MIGTRALVSIDGYDLPEPSAYSGNTSTLVDGGRNVEGVFVGAVIRDDVAKVEMQWSYLTAEQWSSILKLFKISSGGNFVRNVTFFDQVENAYATREMYVGDRSAPMWRRDSNTGKVLGWTDCALSLIEV